MSLDPKSSQMKVVKTNIIFKGPHAHPEVQGEDFHTLMEYGAEPLFLHSEYRAFWSASD